LNTGVNMIAEWARGVCMDHAPQGPTAVWYWSCPEVAAVAL